MTREGGEWPNGYVRAYEAWTDWMIEEGFEPSEIYKARSETSNIHLSCISNRGGMALRWLTNTDTLLWNTDMRRKLKELLETEIAKAEREGAGRAKP